MLFRSLHFITSSNPNNITSDPNINLIIKLGNNKIVYIRSLIYQNDGCKIYPNDVVDLREYSDLEAFEEDPYVSELSYYNILEISKNYHYNISHFNISKIAYGLPLDINS